MYKKNTQKKHGNLNMKFTICPLYIGILEMSTCVLWQTVNTEKKFWGLGGRVLDSRPRGGRFKPHQRHFVVSLSKMHLSLLSSGLTQKSCHDITEKLLTGT